MSEIDPSFWANEGLVGELSPGEKALRTRFVDEYMFDYSATAAAIRCGFGNSFAETYATQFMQEPYVRKMIADRQQALSDNPKEEAELTKRRIRAALLREAHYRGPGSSHAARVSALGQLKQVYGMDAPTKISATHEHRGGVMMVPAIADVTDWEAAAVASQEALQKASEVT